MYDIYIKLKVYIGILYYRNYRLNRVDKLLLIFTEY